MASSITDAYQRYFPLLSRKCARMLGDQHEAQDVAQETFVRLHQARLWDQDARLVTAWLYRTSTRLAIDRLRTRKRQRTDSDTPGLDALPMAGSPEAQLSAQQLWAALARDIPAAELEVGLLTRVDGLTQAEVAEVTQLHPRSIRRMLVRFEARLAHTRDRSEG